VVNQQVSGDLVKEIAEGAVSDFERLQREEGLTEDEAAKMVVWGNKEGLPSFILGKRVR